MHRLDESATIIAATIAFIAFGCCASSVYLLNDLFDLPADRVHPRKRHRPLASGMFPVRTARAMVPVLLGAGLAIGWMLTPMVAAALAVYFALMVLYDIWLKNMFVADALVLSSGYVMRVVTGGIATGVAHSWWILVACMFLFFGLALLKRYADLHAMRALVGAEPRARAYAIADAPVVLALGASSGVLAVLVLALHAGIEQEGHRGQPWLWAASLLLLAWTSYLWFMAHRGCIREDPVTFALRDRTSVVLAAAMLVMFVGAA